MNLRTAIFNYHCDVIGMTVEKKEQIKNANQLELMCMLFDLSQRDVEEIAKLWNEPDLVNVIEGIKELDEEVSNNGKK